MAKNDKSACPVPKGAEQYGVRGTAWKPMVFTSLACLGVTTAISLSLIILHLRRYRAPKEQRQIVRIVFSVVVYSIVAFFELFRYEIAQYIDPLGDVYEAFGLCALFLLFVQYAAPSGTFDERTFDAVKAAEETPTTFNWPKLGWIFIFQYPVVEILCVAVQEATEATGHYCLNSLSPQFAHIWIEVVESVSIGACVYCILAFRNRMKRLMKVRRGLSKLACFKIIVFIRFMQQWIFSLLLEYHVIKTSAAYSYNDILYGIPATATCAEMVLFSLGFWYAFSSTEYSSKAKPREQALPVWKAALHALNPWDIIAGMARIFPLCGEVRRTGDWQAYRLATRDKGISGAVRKGIRKYKNRKGQGQGRYQELDEGAESLTQPAEMHYIPSESRESYQDPGYFPMSGGISGSDMYQVPAGSPPGEVESHLMGEINAGGRPRSSSQSYLMAESVPSARPRASSQSSLMVESQHEPRRPREPSVGHLYDERNGRSRSPSSRRFVDAPTEGREIV